VRRGAVGDREQLLDARPGAYLIEGPAFIYSYRQTGRVSTILGYPTRLLAPPS
jgi:hypothetical protein